MQVFAFRPVERATVTKKMHEAPTCDCGHTMDAHRFLSGACGECACKAVSLPIFVFGSNLAGVHGAGSALHARRFYGALQGVGTGRQGWSYAIPTKDRVLRVMPLDAIRPHVLQFLSYARQAVQHRFAVVEIGCGLAGYQPTDIAPLFAGFPSNVDVPLSFRHVLAQ